MARKDAQSSAAERPGVVGRPFEPGKSGNPGGLPAHVKAIRDLCGKHSEAAFMVIVRLLKSEQDKVRLAAAEAILDRAGIKPIQGLQLLDGEGNPATPVLEVRFVRPGDGSPVP